MGRAAATRVGVRRWWAACLLACTLQAAAHGDLHEQIEAVTAKLRVAPNDAQLLFHRAELLRDHEDWAASLRDYDRVAALVPGQPSVHLGRGKLMLAMGRLAEARADLDLFLASDPSHADGLATRGRIHLAMGRFDAAAADLGAAIAASPSPDAELYLDHAEALARAGRGPDAVATLDAGFVRLGRPVTLGLKALEIEQRACNTDGALARLDALRAGQARQESWLERRGDLQAACGRDDAARQDWRAARAALDALPPRLATTGAMRALRDRLQRKLAPASP